MSNRIEITITDNDLRADAVEALVAKWGEGERAGCVLTIAAKSRRTLEIEYAMRHGATLSDCERPEDLSRNIASGDADDGHS